MIRCCAAAGRDMIFRFWKGWKHRGLSAVKAKKPIVFTAEGERLAVELMKKYGLGDRKEDEV